MDRANFMFCQNNLHGISFSAFEDMRKKGDLCDVTIQVKDHSFMAHRVILAAGIPYFRSLFTGATEHTEEHEYSVEDFDPRALGSLIDFAYSSKILITPENAQSLCLAAQFLQLQQIRDACVEFMSTTLSMNNIMQVRAFAYNLGNMNLTENTNRFINDNFEQFYKTSDFLNLPYSLVKETIAKDDLRVSNEETVFRAVMEWVKAFPEERRAMLLDLLREVRMIFLPVDYLVKKVASEELIRNSKSCSDLVDEVKNYHLLQKSRSTFSSLKTLPRKSSSVAKATLRTAISVNKPDLHGVSSTRKDGIYAICQDSDKPVSVHYCDFENDKWHHVTSGLENGKVVSVVGVNKKLYVFLEEAILTLRQKTAAWQLLQPRHEFILGAAVLAYGSRIYFFGSHMVHFMDQLRSFNIRMNEWEKAEKMETGRQCSSASSEGYCVYVSGGLDSACRVVSDVEMLDTFTGKWTKVCSMLNPRYLHHSCSMNKKIYVCGGVSNSKGVLPDPEVYEPLSDQWTAIAPIRMRMLRSLVPYKNKIFAFGLDNHFGKGALTEIYDTDKDEWQTSYCVPERFQYAVSLPARTSRLESVRTK